MRLLIQRFTVSTKISEKCDIFIFFLNKGVKYLFETAVYNKRREVVEREQHHLNRHRFIIILKYLIF